MILISNIYYGQTINTNFKCECTDATKVIVDKLQSLTSTNEDNFIEFRVYGTDSMQSDKYIQYMKLYDTAIETELLGVLESGAKFLNSATWGYVYMAYACHCDKKKIKENPLPLYKNCFVNVQNGFDVQRDMPFLKFKSFCRLDGKYEPHLKQ